MKDLPIHEKSRKQSIEVLPLRHKNPYDHTALHRHAYFEILLIKSGQGTQRIDFEDHDLRNNSCFIVFPGQVHLVQCHALDSGWVTQFSPEWLSDASILKLQQTFKFGHISPLIFVEDDSKYNLLESILNQINHPSAANKERFQRLQLESLLELIVEMINEQSTSSSGSPKVIQQFLSSLEHKFHEEHELQFYAGICGTQSKKLSGLCKKYLGLSGLNIIHNRILVETKRKLLTGSDSFSEIAYSLGFNSHSSFNNFIKRKTKKSVKDLKSDLEKS